MAKKSAKDRIKEKKLLQEQKKNSYRAAEEQRVADKAEAERKALLEKEKKEREAEISRIEKENPGTASVKKSKAKAAGLKATFVLSEDKLLMTSFGKGSEAIRDKYIVGDSISDAMQPATLKVAKDPDEKSAGFLVSGRVTKNAKVDNPLKSSRPIGMDQIRCKDKLEKIYFGKTFEDNLHIQLIYNILDIEKILTVHVNNIVFEIGNLLRRDDEEHDDLIGYMSDRYSYEKFKTYKGGELYSLFQELLNKPQMGYFGSTFLGVDAKGKKLKGEAWEKFEEKCYYLLVILGIARQATAHGEESTRANLFRIDELTKGNKLQNYLDELYNSRIDELNESFIKTSGKDIHILCDILGDGSAEKKERIIQDFYSFVILKTYKNMGFSIKKVRENLKNVFSELADDKYNSVRKKLNKLLDFIIWDYYVQNYDRLNNLVDQLRAATKESEKEYIYRREAKALWEAIGSSVEHSLLPKMDGDVIKDISGLEYEKSVLKNVMVSNDADSFSKMIYLLTTFLDGKEINDLLTQLVSKFEGINSFLRVMAEENIETSFADKYVIFEKSEKITQELRVINSFSRMSQESANAKKIMFEEAAELLGYAESEAESLDDYLDGILSNDKSGGKQNKGFRNFIANNVIESDRFKYLVRYGNPKKIKKLSTNRGVIDFVLKEIPNEQIVAYYNSCKGTKDSYHDEMRAALAELITGISFKDFENVKQGNTKIKEEAEDKERKKNIVRLYLTVLYLLIKNLVYINSRYYLAFHCMERDNEIYNSDVTGDAKKEWDRKQKDDISQFARMFLDENPFNIRAKRYISTNMDNSDAWAVRSYRNCVEHINAIRNMDKYIGDIREFDSYFELYHYLVQRSIMDQYEYDSTTESKKNPGTMIISSDELNAKTLRYFELIKNYKTYCKDFVKALNVPFAYNLARYKNLSINELFDRNNCNIKEAGSIKPEE